MHNRRLIDRQTALLRHLTGEAFMFGTGDLAAAALDPDLQGMDVARLRLEAEFSFAKRTGRIRETFARTASLYGSRFKGMLREFAAACPPRTYERYPDARDFFDWLEARCAGDARVPAWVADVAKVEIALAHARTFRPSEAEEDTLAGCPSEGSCVWYRTHPCVALARCRFDVGPLFVPGRSGEDIVRRDLTLAMLASRDRRHPEIMEIVPEAFALLERSSAWSRLGLETASSEDAATRALVMSLSVQGLVLTWGNALGGDRG